MFQKATYRFLLLAGLTVLNSCATYYDKNRSTEQALVTGNFEEARQGILSNKFLGKKRNQLLFNLEMGKISYLNGDFNQSNQYFNEADRLSEEYRNLAEMAVGVTINPSLQPYKAEFHEEIMMHYYKCMNYLQLGDLDEALVEVRRIDLDEKKQEISTKGNDRKYSKDPFGLLLMGMIYEASGDNNNAFIAYRNAKEAYDADQTGIFSSSKPKTLEQDILRTAKRSGIYYESDSVYDASYGKNGELILFFESGLSPVKFERNYFFSFDENENGFFFQSDNLIIPVDFDFKQVNSDFSPSDLGVLRLAFPYYVNRVNQFEMATVNINGRNQQMEMAQDISALAFQVEKDNFFKNLGRDLIRITVKKLTELALAQKNEYAGAALNIANAATEKADTRNWQSLPGQLQFIRIPLEEGNNTITLNAGNQTRTLDIEGNGSILFRNISEFQ